MTDRLASYGQAVLAVRWGAVSISLALASPDIADGDGRLAGALGLLAVWTLLRTVRPLHLGDDRPAWAWLLLEAAIAAGAVAATGYGDSTLVFALLVPGVLAGFAGGFRLGGTVALATILAVALPWVADDAGLDDLRGSADWAGEVLLVAFVAGYARRVSGEADERREAAMDRLGRLSDANVLLFQLHQVTQSLPASLDLTEVLDATVVQLRDLFDADGVAIVLFEESDAAWHTVRRQGLQVAATFPEQGLPGPLARTVAVRSTAVEDDLAAGTGPGLDASSRSGLYGVLTTRGSTIGIVALEHVEPSHFTDRDVELITGFVDAAALAVDNARWFGRLRTLGADEERSRIARDLHDRTGQSLAYLAFELDRITKQSGQGKDVTPAALDGLRGDVRKVVGELRDTLYDLRTDVTESDGLASTLAGFLERVGERSGLRTELVAEETARLPLLRERELWRIAREAVTAVERHAQATAVVVTWRCDGQAADLEVDDDGVARASTGGSLGTPELTALRERAASIGATFTVLARPGGGTRVRCALAG